VLDGSEARSEWLNTSRVPPSALVVFLTPLWSERYTGQIVRLQARGRETAVVQLRTEALLGPPPAAGAEGQARRLFDLLVADRADELRRSGINLVEWDPDSSLTESVSSAARSQLRRRIARSA